PENYEKFKKTTARLNELELYEAYKNSLLLVMELRNLVEKQYQLTISDDFLGKLFNYMNE
ncbi:lincosamide nucleotidyltransferase Lnu(B), partial [Escherichia coli]|nr:lincosamide nucleotidyltransferase Lnu(B) [Escherichia coli]